MKKAGDSRAEELRVERERELEEMKMLRAQAIEEEEQERAEMEAIKRLVIGAILVQANCVTRFGTIFLAHLLQLIELVPG